MTHKEFVTKAIDSLTDIYPLGEARAIAVRVLTHYLHLTEYEYIIEPNVIIPKSDLNKLQEALTELLDYRPLQYVLGYEEFAGHRFNVSESVLIPRPETEELFRKVVRDSQGSSYSGLRILDACTGSGCIAYSLAASFPKAVVMACDISDDALKVANGQKIFLDEACKQPLQNLPVFFKWNVLEGPPEEKDMMNADNSLPDIRDIDILISNPPYVCEHEKDFMRRNVFDYEPDEALFVPDDDPLRFYKALAGWASQLLVMGGKAYFEINESYPREVADLFEGMGFSEVTLIDDIHGKPRFVTFTSWMQH